MTATRLNCDHAGMDARVTVLEAANRMQQFTNDLFWSGSSGSRGYVDVPVAGLSASYRRDVMFVFISPNSDGKGWFGYFGITNSGTTTGVTELSDSYGLTVTVSTDKTNDTVRISGVGIWSAVLVMSVSRLLRL